MANGCIYYPPLPGYTRPPLSPELTAALKKSEEQAERMRTDPEYHAYIWELRRKCREGPPLFGGMDDAEIQRVLLEAWYD